MPFPGELAQQNLSAALSLIFFSLAPMGPTLVVAAVDSPLVLQVAVSVVRFWEPPCATTASARKKRLQSWRFLAAGNDSMEETPDLGCCSVLQHRHCKREVTIILMEACHQSTLAASRFHEPFLPTVRCALAFTDNVSSYKITGGRLNQSSLQDRGKHLSHSNRLWLKIPGPSTYLDPSIPNIYIYI